MSEHGHPHIAPLKTYLNVFAALMVLTLLTVWVAFFDLGVMNIVVAVTIACIKAYIVVLYFMHVKYGAKIIWLTAAAGFVWFLLMFGLTLADFATRGWLPFPEPW